MTESLIGAASPIQLGGQENGEIKISFNICKIVRILRCRGFIGRSQISPKRLKTSRFDYHGWISRKTYYQFISKIGMAWNDLR